MINMSKGEIEQLKYDCELVLDTTSDTNAVYNMALITKQVIDATPLGYVDPAVLKTYRGQRTGGMFSPEKRTGEKNQVMPVFIVPPVIQEQHADDIAIDAFSAEMKAKMGRSRNKGRDGWQDKDLVSDKELAKMLVEHLSKGNAGTFEDIATFCMMLHQRGADPQVLKEAMTPEPISVEKMNQGLELHHLKSTGHSQLSDAFRSGANWALTHCVGCDHDFELLEQKYAFSVFQCTKCGMREGRVDKSARD